MSGSQIFARSIGSSVEGLGIPACANFDLAAEPVRQNTTLIIGGTHGDEADRKSVV